MEAFFDNILPTTFTTSTVVTLVAGIAIGWFLFTIAIAARVLITGEIPGFSKSTKPETPSELRKRLDKCLPKRVILVRHGQSEGNVNHEIYKDVPDNALHLTELGKRQARMAGRIIKNIIGEESVRFIVSPYVRTVDTFKQILKSWTNFGSDQPWSEEPRIREQDFGNFQDPVRILECKNQRNYFGNFFYRFPSGESPADVYDRISSFLESLHRMFRRHDEENYVLVCHGVTIRVILMRYFHLSVNEFEKLDNLMNGEVIVLENNGNGRLELSKVLTPVVDKLDGEDSDVVSMHTSSELRLRNAFMSPLARRRGFVGTKDMTPPVRNALLTKPISSFCDY